MESENQSPRLHIDLNEVINDVVTSIVDSESNDVTGEDAAMSFDLNEDAEYNNIDNEEDEVEVNNNINEHDSPNRSNREEESSRTPAVGMYFASGEEFTKFCHTYAFEKGFQFFVRSSVIMNEYREKGINRLGVGEMEPKGHMMSRIRLVCKMDTKDRRKKKSGRKISCAPTKCKVCVEARFSNGWFYIKNCVLSHDHELFPNDSRLMVNYRGIDDGAYENMVLNDSAEISMTKSYNSIVIARGGQENLSFNKSDLRNAVNIVRRRVIFGGDADAVQEYFEKMSDANSNFYSAIQTDEEGKLVNVFWADARARAQYKDFGDIVTFDTTFLCNK